MRASNNGAEELPENPTDDLDELGEQVETGFFNVLGVAIMVGFVLPSFIYSIGRYRLQVSQDGATHVAVVRDGVLISQEKHLGKNKPIMAGLLCFDHCILVSAKEETVSLDPSRNAFLYAGISMLKVCLDSNNKGTI